jgi:uncharacterized membrane protein YozB (DUF420 family)
MTIQDLPLLNAILNSIATMLLVSGWVLIKRGREEAHKKAMLSAVVVSALFLASYLTYHFNTAAVTLFPKDRFPNLAPYYYGMLLTHVVLAVVILPLVLMTLRYAFRDDRKRHRRLARITLPIWLYVSVTGVLIYLVLYKFCR